MYRVLRWGPMAAADLVAEFFDTEPLRATVAARGIFGTFLGTVVGGQCPGAVAARRCRSHALSAPCNLPPEARAR